METGTIVTAGRQACSLVADLNEFMMLFKATFVSEKPLCDWFLVVGKKTALMFKVARIYGTHYFWTFCI